MPDGSNIHGGLLALPSICGEGERWRQAVLELEMVQMGIDFSATGKQEMVTRFHELSAKVLIRERAVKRPPREAILRWLVQLNSAMEDAEFGRHDHWIVRGKVEKYLLVRLPALIRRPQLVRDAASRFRPM